MTDVVILQRIPGHKPGDVVPMTPRLEQHVAAGNAKIIPNRHDAFSAPEQPRDSTIPALHAIGTGSVDDLADDDEDSYDDED